MLGFLVFIHLVVSVLLVTAVLMQAGKGGGLTESAAGAESMLGAQTNIFMVKLTAVFATLFMATSLTLAFLSTKRDKSLMENADYTAPMEAAVDAGAYTEQAIENGVEETDALLTEESFETEAATEETMPETTQ